jgi:hypothetical protein
MQRHGRERRGVTTHLPSETASDVRKERAMTSKVLCVSVVSAVAATAASAHHTEWALTVPKAEQVVTEAATIRLPRPERASLEAELRAAIGLYRTLEETAGQQPEGYERLASRLHNLRYRFSTALKQVQRGLEIAQAACAGTGAAVTRDRFKRFRCAVTSEELEIPSAEVVWEGELITAVVEDEPRIEGPFRARLHVHLTGKSTIAFRQIG